VTNETLPRPSNWLLVVSVLNIGICLYLFFGSVAAIVVASLVPGVLSITLASGSYSFSFWLGLFTGPFWITTAIQQYRGTFRCVPSAAKMCSVLLRIAGYLISPSFGVIYVASEAFSGLLAGWKLFGVMCLAIASPLLLLAAARLNAKWGRVVSGTLSSLATSANQRGYSLRELFLAMGIFAAMSAVVAHRIRPSLPEYANIPWQAEHVDISAAPFGLPPNATDISYRQGFRGELIYEFTIDESSFRNWVNTQVMPNPNERFELPLSEITSLGTFETRRYNGSRVVAITVTDGLAFQYWEYNHIEGAYDRTTGRAYYYRARQW